MINKTGELIDHIMEAVAQHGATPHTDILVRVGALGPTYRINRLQGQNDGRGFRLVLQLNPVPESVG